MNTTLDQAYTFISPPQNTKEIEESEGKEAPVYLDSENSPYDRFYRKINMDNFLSSEAPKYITNPFTKEMTPTFFSPIDKISTTFPDPIYYSQKGQYTTALEEWYVSFCKFYSSVVLPVPLSGEYYLPSFPKIFTKEEKSSLTRFRTFKPNLWPLLPTNYLILIGHILHKIDIDPKDNFPELIPKRDPIKFKDHMTSENQWQAQLMPHEPEPIIYDKFEDFEEAYVNWANITHKSLNKPPIPPNQLSSLIGLDITEQSKEKSKPALKYIEKGTEQSLEGFAKQTTVTDTKKIGFILHDLYKIALREGIMEKNTTETVDKNILVLTSGVSSDFAQQIADFGYYIETCKVSSTKSEESKQIRPIMNYFHFLRPENFNDLITSIQSSAKTVSTLLDLIEIDLTDREIDKIMKIPICGSTYIQIIARSTKCFSLLLKYKDFTLQYRQRISFIFHAFFRNDKGVSFYRSLKNDLSLFEEVVRIMYFIVDPRYVLRTSTSSGNVRNDIYCFYLTSLLIFLNKANPTSDSIRDAVTKSRKLSVRIARKLQNQEIAKLVRYDDIGLTMMLAESFSPQIHRVLLGNDFLFWLNEISKRGRVGSALIQTIAHSVAIKTAALIFVRNGSKMMQKAATFSPVICSFVCSICYALHRLSHEHYLQFTGQSMLTILESCALEPSEHSAVMIDPVTVMICDQSFISNFDALSFQPLLAGTVVKFCRSINHNNPIIYGEQIKALYRLAVFENCCLAMTMNKAFVEITISHLIDQNEMITDRNWKFFRRLTESPKILLSLLGEERVKEVFKQIPEKSVRSALFNLLNFCHRVWAKYDMIYKNELCKTVQPSLGVLMCIYNRRNIIFKDDGQMLNAFDQFSNDVKTLKPSQETTEFKLTFNKHQDQNDANAKFQSSFIKRTRSHR